MRDELVTSASPRQCLRELLLDDLRRLDAGNWPGVDGQTVEDVLLCYQQQATAGLVPDRCELLRNHPVLGEELGAFFSDHDQSRGRTEC
jgi:hypothetical protein